MKKLKFEMFNMPGMIYLKKNDITYGQKSTSAWYQRRTQGFHKMFYKIFSAIWVQSDNNVKLGG